MTPFGKFKGRHLVVRDPTQRYWVLQYRPGSYFMFWSSIVEHAITPLSREGYPRKRKVKSGKVGYFTVKNCS